MRTRLAFNLSLVVRSPFLFRDPGGARFGIDAAPLRGADGRPLIPADQLRGVLLEAMTDIFAAAPSVLSDTDLKDLFGEAARDARDGGGPPQDDAFAPRRANIVCDDLHATGRWPAAQAVRVAIEPERGAARPGFLQIVELVAPPATEVEFTGSLVVFAPVGSEERIQIALERAWALIGQIGAQKSVGFGSVVAERSTIALARTDPLSMPAATGRGAVAQPATYRMCFDRPFLVDAQRAADNLFVGSEVVPGAVIKGALARRLELGGEDPVRGRFATLLAETTFTHAFPENDRREQIGQPLPLSLVAVKRGNGFLFADTLGQGEGKGALLDSEPALYASDWKDDWPAAARVRLQMSSLSDTDYIGQVLRVHTKIDGDKGTAASGLLFATVALSHCVVDPKTGGATGDARGWRLSVIPPANADPGLWGTLLALLEQGLDGVGRTGASVSLERMEPTRQPQASPIVERNGRVGIMLITPAVLFDAVSGKSAHEAYDAYWKQMLPGSRLVDHVARQRLAGGYLAQRRRAYKSGYVPFVLTEAGAVFLLEGVDRGKLAALMRTGLPLPTLDGRQADWRTCPFVPQNGYGAFVADHLERVSGLDEAHYV